MLQRTRAPSPNENIVGNKSTKKNIHIIVAFPSIFLLKKSKKKENKKKKKKTS